MTAALVAQITDPHIVANARLCLNQIDTASLLRNAVDTLSRLASRPDAVVITGDLVNEGRVSQYQHLRTLLAPLTIPTYLLPGNHDHRASLREVFADHPELGTTGTCDWVVNVGDLRVIGLDTVVEGAPGGDLRPEQFDWLAARLDEAGSAPVLLAMHHPPVATGIAHMDAMALAPDAARTLETLVGAHPNIERVVCGHVHRCISRRWAGTVVSVSAGVAHAVAFDLRPEGPSAWNYEPPAVTLHHWNGAALVTHQVAVGDYRSHRYGM
jgi:3',5'-cyclic AMP phosphodiesterase CpdA